ncbi:acyl-CoA synthetase [Ventosimonas gracilis]|uniref:Acyl-CoA synthetase n=1 Tax=Ventosimonas gracilis TaxID=1680762 RepID=A0A139SME9_9GAMM|nr:acetate--CoA ligase family protein [Ventosimonas gracilis]KXU35758.1 acyl-CoA synthetase [Ventosimonas gracilis]
MNKKDNLKRLLAPKSLAFIGGRSMAQSARRCLESGFNGEVWLVNPKYPSLEGMDCIASTFQLPKAPDAVFIGTNRALCLEAVKELAQIGAGGVICYASGFAEAGEAGSALQQELLQSAGDMALLGPNCYGLLNYLHSAALWPVAHGGKAVEQGVAVLTQSGNFAYNLSMSERSLPIAYMASVGNQAQLGFAELMEALLDEPKVTAIGLHLEGLRDVAAFARAAFKALEKGVPIIALKTGVSPIGAELALSHTSSLAGSDALYDALFTRLGVIRVDTPSRFIETLKVAASGQKIKGTRLLALACSGGDAGLIADGAYRHQLALPALSQAQKSALQQVLPDYANIANPLDFTTAIWGDQPALEQMLNSALPAETDAALLVLDYPSEQSGERYMCDLLLDCYCQALKRHGKNGFIACNLPEFLPESARERLHAAGIPALQGLDDALFAWASLARYSSTAEMLLTQGEAALPPLPPAPINGRGKAALDEWQSKQALKAFGLPLPQARLCTPERAASAAAELGYPLALKVVSADLPHKTEAGGVALNLDNEAELQSALQRMQQSLAEKAPNVPFEQILLERMAEAPLAELIIGVKREEGFALALVIGSGGILVELLKDSLSLLLPTTDAAIERALLNLRIAPLLLGFRGRAAADMPQLIAAIRAIADYACTHAGNLLELDVNPLLVTATGAVAVDALIRLAD